MTKFSNPLGGDGVKFSKPTPPTGQNSRPNANQNNGAGPLIGDRQRIPLPPLHRIASSAPATKPNAVPAPRGIDGALGALADKLHPPKRR